MNFLKSIHTRWVQYICKHDWEYHHCCEGYYDHEEWYECTICHKQEETDKGTYL